ncbi:MAG: hypothetical protein RL557_648, partial [archaeon]
KKSTAANIKGHYQFRESNKSKEFYLTGKSYLGKHERTFTYLDMDFINQQLEEICVNSLQMDKKEIGVCAGPRIINVFFTCDNCNQESIVQLKDILLFSKVECGINLPKDQCSVEIFDLSLWN